MINTFFFCFVLFCFAFFFFLKHKETILRMTLKIKGNVLKQDQQCVVVVLMRFQRRNDKISGINRIRKTL